MTNGIFTPEQAKVEHHTSKRLAINRGTMKKQTFKSFKEQFISTAQNAGTSCGKFQRAKDAKNKGELLRVIVDNIAWCYLLKVVSVEFLLSLYSESEMAAIGLFVSGNHKVSVNEGEHAFYTLGSSSATVEAWGRSSATYDCLGRYSTIKDLTKKRLIYHKDAFTIVEL